MKRPPVVKSPFWSGNVPDLQDALSFFSSLAPRYGEVCAFRTFRQWRYYVQNPDLIQQILTSHQWVRTPISRKLLGSFLGESVFSQEGDLHLSQRRLMQPAFHRERLAHYAQTMVAQTARTLESWRDGEQRDMVDEMMRLTLEIVSQVLFGTSTSAEAKQIGAALLTIQHNIQNDYTINMFLPLWLPVLRFGEARRVVQRFQQTTQRIIAARRAEGRAHDDLLDTLLRTRDEDGARLTDGQVAGQVSALLFAGHETTANALAWALYLLVKHPQVLAKLRAEVEAVCGARLPSMADLPRLKYTEMVFKEVLRLHPSLGTPSACRLRPANWASTACRKARPSPSRFTPCSAIRATSNSLRHSCPNASRLRISAAFTATPICPSDSARTSALATSLRWSKGSWS